MFTSRRKRALVWMTCCLSTACSPTSLLVSAFTGNNISASSLSSPSSSQQMASAVTRTTTRSALYASKVDNNKSKTKQSTRRRGFLQTVGSAVAGIATAAVFRGDNTNNGGSVGVSSPALAIADISTSSDKRVVQMEVANLGGVPGNTGTFKIQLRPEWAPRGAKRFEELTEAKFFNDCRIFRVLPGFVSQFGISGDPMQMAKWRSSSLPDDPIKVSNSRGTVTFATAGPNTRTTQVFINTREAGNTFLDKQGFTPFGIVIDGMDVVDEFYSSYGDGPPGGDGPNQALIQAKGNEYLNKQYPKLSYISKATLV